MLFSSAPPALSTLSRNGCLPPIFGLSCERLDRSQAPLISGSRISGFYLAFRKRVQDKRNWAGGKHHPHWHSNTHLRTQHITQYSRNTHAHAEETLTHTRARCGHTLAQVLTIIICVCVCVCDVLCVCAGLCDFVIVCCVYLVCACGVLCCVTT